MAVKRKYRLNLRNYGNLPAIMLSQYDEGYALEFEIRDGTDAASDLSAYTVTLKGTRADTLAYSFSGTISTNVLTFVIDTTMTACAGRGTAEIAIKDTANDVLFATFNMPVFVERAAVPEGSIDADVERAQEIAEQVQEIVDNAAAAVSGEAEKWATGQIDGTDVPSTDPTYENNAKYYAEQAETAAASIGIDATLTQAGKAADAKKTGDEITALKEDLIKSLYVYNRIKNKYIKSADGGIATYNGWDMTDYIPVMDRMLIYSPERNIYCWWYKSDKSPLSQRILSAGMNEYNPPENAAYIAISNSRSVMENTLVYNGAYIQSKHSADYAEILDKGIHFEETMDTTEGVALSTSLYPQGIIANVDYEVKYTNSWGCVRSIYGLTLFGEGGVTQQYESITVFEPKTINVPFDVVKVDVYVASNVTATGTVTLTIDKKGISDIGDAPQSLGITDVDITNLGDALIYRKLSPSYYFDLVGEGTSAVGEYLANKANSMKTDGVRFAFYTDSHYPRSVHNAEEIINYIRYRTGIKYVINGGDYIDKYSSKFNGMADMSKCVNPMISAFGHNFLPVLGDHDNNTYGWSTPEELANAMIPYVEINKRLYAGLSLDAAAYNPIEKMETMSFYNSADRDEWIAYFANNYYVDDVEGKVRYIICNTGNVDGIQKTTFGLSTPSEVKLVLPFVYDAIMNAPNGYSIVYACHRVVSQPNVQFLSATVCGMLGAAKAKNNAYRISVASDNTNLQEWYNNETAIVFDFSDAPTIDKVMCVSGHAHEDFVVVVNGNDGTYDFWDGISAINVSGGYVPVVITQTDSLGAYDDGTISPNIMTENTITEHCVDFIQIDDENINVTRIGAGNDRTIPIS